MGEKPQKIQEKEQQSLEKPKNTGNSNDIILQTEIENIKDKYSQDLPDENDDFGEESDEQNSDWDIKEEPRQNNNENKNLSRKLNIEEEVKKRIELKSNEEKDYLIIIQKQYIDKLSETDLQLIPDHIDQIVGKLEPEDEVLQKNMIKAIKNRAKTKEKLTLNDVIAVCIIEALNHKYNKTKKEEANKLTNNTQDITEVSYNASENKEQLDKDLKTKEKLFNYLKEKGLIDGEFDKFKSIDFDKVADNLYKRIQTDKNFDLDEFIKQYAKIQEKSKDQTRKSIEKLLQSHYGQKGMEALEKAWSNNEVTSDQIVDDAKNGKLIAVIGTYAEKSGYSYSTIQTALDQSRAKDEAEAKKKAEKEAEAKNSKSETAENTIKATNEKGAELSPDQRKELVDNNPALKTAPEFFKIMIKEGKGTESVMNENGDAIITMNFDADVETKIILPKDSSSAMIELNTKVENSVKLPLTNFRDIETLIDTELSCSFLDGISAVESAFSRGG